MDGYPEHLEPSRDEWGGIDKAAFKQWWTQASPAFPGVPENVGQYWLHEHWGRSPYCHLKSSTYRFELVSWPSSRLLDIRSTWDDFDPECKGCIAKGKQLCTEKLLGKLYATAEYILEHRKFPVPIIVLDNRDGHANDENQKHWPVPDGYVLIEGHTRFNIATYLQTVGALDEIDLWLMQKIPT